MHAKTLQVTRINKCDKCIIRQHVHELTFARFHLEASVCWCASNNPAVEEDRVFEIESGISLSLSLSKLKRLHAHWTNHASAKSGLPPVSDTHLGTFSVTFIQYSAPQLSSKAI